MAKQDDYVRYTIRVPANLYDRVQAAAEGGGRSVNAEVVQRLESSFETGLAVPAGEEWHSAVKESIKEGVVELLRDPVTAKLMEEFLQGYVMIKSPIKSTEGEDIDYSGPDQS